MKTLKLLFAASAAVVLSFGGLTVSAADIKLTMNTWENLANAVAGASAGDVIWVTPAEGKYGAGEYFEATSTIAITKSLSIVSADKDKPLKIYNGASKLPAFSISSLAGDVTFSEVVFLGADNSTASSPQRGMIDSSADKLYLSYCTFDGCTAGLGTSLKGYAGAVRASGSLLKVNDCLFRNCRVTKLIDSSISGETTHCAGAVSTTAKEAIFLRCSFIDNGVKGFKNAGDFMGNATPAAIVADHFADTPDAGQPPVLTILKSTFSGNLGGSTVFAANSGVRIVNSTFIDNGPATDNSAYGGRAVRYWHSSAYKNKALYASNGNIRIANSVFLGNREGDGYLDIQYTGDIEPDVYYSIFSKGTSFGSFSGVSCKYLSTADSATWYTWFLNGDSTGVEPVVADVLGVEHYAYPLAAKAYEGGYKVACNLYYDTTIDTTPRVYGLNGNPETVLWTSLGVEAQNAKIQNSGVDFLSCVHKEGGTSTYLPSCGSAASYPTVVKYKKNKTGSDVYETEKVMWNYEKVQISDNDHEEPGCKFTGWDLNGKTYLPDEWVELSALSTQSFGEERPDSEIVLQAIFTADSYFIFFQTDPDSSIALTEAISATYGEEVTIHSPSSKPYDGYTVQGWATSAERAAAGTIDYTENATVTFTGTSNLNLYWVNRQPNTATYAFKKIWKDSSDKGITGEEFNMVVTTDGQQMMPTCPFVRPGYKFKCWYTGDYSGEYRYNHNPGDSFGKVEKNGATVPVYADWEAVGDDGSFALTYNANDGSESSTVQLVMPSSGAVQLKTAAELSFSKEGCTLVGWSKDQYCDLEEDWFYKPGDSAWDVAEKDVAAITLYAVWQDNAGSNRTCPTGEGDISLLISIIDASKKTACLQNVMSKEGILANWTIPDTATSSDEKVWTIVEYGGGIAAALSGVPEITIGKSVTSGAECLQYDSGMQTRTKIYVPEENTAYASLDGLLVSKDKTRLLAVPCAWDNEAHTLDIPEGITTIESGSCEALKKIKTVIIPSTVATDGAVKSGSFGTDEHGQNWGSSPLSGGGITQFYFRGDFQPSYMESPDVFYATSWAVQTCPPIVRIDVGYVIGFIPHPSKDPNQGHTCAVTVPEGVTGISASSFQDCAQMTSLTLPSTLDEIGECAFMDCTNLTEVVLPDAVTYIDTAAFEGCSNLVSLTGASLLGNYPNSVGYGIIRGTKIEANADAAGSTVMLGSVLLYQGDNGALPATLEVSSDVTGIAGGAFNALEGVTRVNLPTSVEWIGETAFEECDDLAYIRLYNETETDSYFADQLSNASLTTLEIYGLANIDTLTTDAWYGDDSSVYLVIGKGITTIPNEAYNRTWEDDMDIQDVSGGEDLEFVGRDAFTGHAFAEAGNRAIGNFYVGYFGTDTAIDMGDYNKNVGDTKAGYLTRVSPSAFKTLTTAKTLKFGKYVEEGQLTGSMFDDLTSLTAYSIDSSAANYSTDENGILYNKAKTKIIAVPKGFATTWFTIPETVTEIGECAFAECQYVTYIYGGWNVTNIGTDAFRNCPGDPYKYSAFVRLWDCAHNCIQTDPCAAKQAYELPHPTNIAAVVESIPYGYWPLSGKWYCSNDGQEYKDTFVPENMHEYYDLKPVLESVDGYITIAYDKNAADATGTMSGRDDLQTGEVFELAANAFERPGYSFKNWNTEKDGSGLTFADEATACFDWPETFAGDTVTLYAQWTEKASYTIAFDGASEYATNIPDPMTGYIGEFMTLPDEVPQREGWTFGVWNNAGQTKGWSAGSKQFILYAEDVSAGETYTLYAAWNTANVSGLDYKDAKDSEWVYDRTGDAIVITSVTPGPTAAYPLTMPDTINGGTVDKAHSAKLPIKINNIWWNWEVIDESSKTCGLGYPILGSGKKLPASLNLPETIEGYKLVSVLYDDAFAEGTDVTSITLSDGGEQKTVWGEKDGSGKVTTIHFPGAAPQDWTCSFKRLFYNATTCCYDPDETSWTAYKAAHPVAEEGLAFAEEGTYEIRFNKNAADATGTMPNKVCVIGRKYPPLEGTELINYSRPGSVFVDWFFDEACTDEQKAGLGGEFWNLSTTPGDVVDVYAKWSTATAKAVVEDSGATLRFIYDAGNYGVKGVDWYSVSENEAIEYNDYSCTPPAWLKTGYKTLTKVVFDPSFKSYRPKGCQAWFSGGTLITSIEGISNLDTSSVTNMAYMFSGCENLTPIDVSGFKTENVRDMLCMFLRCYALTSLDLRSFDTAKVADMDGMFCNCSNLTAIAATDAFTTKGVTSSSYYMFSGCPKLEGGSGTKYDDDRTGASFAHIDGGKADPGYFTGTYVSRSQAKAVLKDGGKTLEFVYDDVNYGERDKVWFSVAEAEGKSAWDYPSWHGCDETVTKVSFAASFKSYRPIHCGSWFCDFSNLVTIENPSNLDTSKATSLAQMFSGCWRLASLDISAWDTSKVPDLGYMFYGCTSLKTISVGGVFSTDSVEYSENMFYNCKALKGGAGTTYDSAHVDAAYAHIDNAPTDPGYFTDAGAPVEPTVVKIDRPTATSSEGLVYTGSEQVGVNYDTRLTLEDGDVKGTYPSAYLARFRLPANTLTETYVWSDDGGTGVHPVGWVIFARPVTDSDVTFAEIDDQYYTGAAIEPTVAMSYGGQVRVEDVDYTLEYANNVAVGTATVTVTGKGNFTGTKELTFEIVEAPSGTSVVTFDKTEGVFVTESTRAVENGTAVGALPVTYSMTKEFKGWYTAAAGGDPVTAATIVSGNVTFFAQWQDPPAGAHYVLFQGNGGTLTEYVRFVEDGQAIGELPDCTLEDYDLVGWFTAQTGGDEITAETVVTDDMVAHAQWTPSAPSVAPVAGDYVSYNLETDLGVVIGAYDKNEKVSIQGLPSGLKLVARQLKTTVKKKSVVTDVFYYIEGVASEARDCAERPVYAVVTSGGKTTWQPIRFSVLAQSVTDLGALALGESVVKTDWLTGVTNGWTVSGLPTGLKYTATTVYKDKKKKTVLYPARTVYGKTSKAGLYTVTAKHKVSSFYETLKFQILVNPASVDTTVFTTSLTNRASVVAVAEPVWSLAYDVGKMTSVSGLPTGLKFDSKKQTISGTPSKAGTFVATFKKKVGKKTYSAQILWTVTANAIAPSTDFNVSGGVIEGFNAGSVYATSGSATMTFNVTPGAAVTASGLPKGFSLKKVSDSVWAIAGTPSKVGTSYVTLTVKLNGNTVVQSLAMKVNAHPLAGTYRGDVILVEGGAGAVSLTVSSVGKASLSLTDSGVKSSATDASVTVVSEDPDDPSVGRWTYDFTLAADKKKKLPKRSLTLTFDRQSGEWKLPTLFSSLYSVYGTIADWGEVSLVRALTKTEVAARVAAGRLPEMPSVLTTVIPTGACGEPRGETVATGEVVVVSAAYKASAATYTLTGRLLEGKTFSASSAIVWYGEDAGKDLVGCAPTVAADSDGRTHVLELALPTAGASGGESVLSGYDMHAWGGGQTWCVTRYGLFGGGWTTMPTSMTTALGTALGVPAELTWRAEMVGADPKVENLHLKSWVVTSKKSTKEYVSVTTDGGMTWSNQATVTWSKTTGRASFSVAVDGSSYTFDLAYDKDGLLTGWVRKSHVYKKKTIVDAIGSAAVGSAK